jgi:hypothetical protein
MAFTTVAIAAAASRQNATLVAVVDDECLAGEVGGKRAPTRASLCFRPSPYPSDTRARREFAGRSCHQLIHLDLPAARDLHAIGAARRATPDETGSNFTLQRTPSR